MKTHITFGNISMTGEKYIVEMSRSFDAQPQQLWEALNNPNNLRFGWGK